ncbi:inovirus-type Gp2 protein [Escherichia coli]|nr:MULTISPECIES: inovirus-type Gp2 protein [Enterobacteriaceae]
MQNGDIQYQQRGLVLELYPRGKYIRNQRPYLDVNAVGYKGVYNKLIFRLSYFAKERTKSYSNAERSFGCSQS